MESLLYLDQKLKNSIINSEILLSGCKLIHKSIEIDDKNYLPFYYHLGTQFKAKNVIQIGSKLGLIGYCYMQSCKDVEIWNLIDNFDFCKSFVESNLNQFKKIKVNYSNKKDFENVNADLAFLTEKSEDKLENIHNLNYLWDNLNDKGLLIVDYIHDEAMSQAFDEFCRVKNKIGHKLKTRYGVGLIYR